MKTKDEQVHGKDFVCGLVASLFAITVTYPITKLVYRQIIDGYTWRNAIIKIQQEGFKYLYRGCLPPILKRCTNITLLYGVAGEVNIYMKESQLNPYMQTLISGIISGSLDTLTMPFERVQIILVQSQMHDKVKNFFATLILLKKYGLSEFYRGFSLTLSKNVIGNSIVMIIRQELKNVHESESKMQQALDSFADGAVMGGMLTLAFHPIKVVRVEQQRNIGGSFKTTFSIVRRLYLINGFPALYRGVVPNFLKSIISWGLINSAFDTLKMIT